MPAFRSLMSKTSISTVLSAIVSVFVIVGGLYAFVVWFNGRYVDIEEATTIINEVSNQTNENLKTINGNIILLGNAVYDRQINEIKGLIDQVSKIPNKNANEIQFLQQLQVRLVDLMRQQKTLQQTKINQVIVKEKPGN